MPTREEQIQTALEAKNLRLRQLEAGYLRAKDFQKSLEWQNVRDQVLQRIVVAVAPVDDKDPNRSHFATAKVKQILLEVQEPYDVIVEYEGLKREIETYYAQRGE